MKTLNLVKAKQFRPAKLAIAVTFGVLLTGCKSESVSDVTEPVVRPVFVEMVASEAVADLSFNGTVYSAQRAELSFKTSGRMIERLVDEGDRVKKGQLIAQLDDVDAKIALTSARSEYQNARAEYQRAKTLYEQQRSISKSQFEELKLRFDLAKNSYTEAQRRVDDTQLRAPFSGVVSRTFVDNHVLVQSNETIASLHDLDALDVVIHVPESVMTRGGQAGQVFAQSTVSPFEHFNLTLKKYETEPDSVTRTYAVTFSIETKEEMRLLPGMSVQVYSKSGSNEEKTIQLPLTAVSPDNMGSKYVWIVDENNTLRKRVIVTGSLNGDRVEVESNLNLGEQVVVSGTSNLEEGTVVRPVIAEAY